MADLDDPIGGSSEADVRRMMDRAKEAGLFRLLDQVYGELPETTCENCGRCCFESPGVFFVEYLRLLDLIATMSSQRRDELLELAVRELFFSWIEPDRTCIFLDLDKSLCTVYDNRPLACRLFGLVGTANRETEVAKARLAARQDAQRLGRFGIRIPEAVIQRSLVNCDKVCDRRGRRINLEGDEFAARIGRLDASILPQHVVIREFCFRSLPERLGYAMLGEALIDAIKVQLLRRAQSGQCVTELVSALLSHHEFCWPNSKVRRRQQ